MLETKGQSQRSPFILASLFWLLFQIEYLVEFDFRNSNEQTLENVSHLPSASLIDKELPGAEILELPLNHCCGLSSSAIISRAIDVHESYQDKDPTNRRHVPLVMMLHGFPDTSLTFNASIHKHFSEKGFDVVVPTMPGYEPSSIRPLYFVPGIAEDLRLWLQYFNRTTVHIVGHDWGSVVATEGARRFPHMMTTVTLIAVPANVLQGFLVTPRQLLHSWYFFFFQLPLAPLLWLKYGNGVNYLHQSWGNYSSDDIPPVIDDGPTNDPYGESLKAVFYGGNNTAGVLASTISYYRQNFGVLLIWPLLFCMVITGMGTFWGSSCLISLLLFFSLCGLSALASTIWMMILKNTTTALDIFNAVKVSIGQVVESFQLASSLATEFHVPILGIAGLQDQCIMPKLYNISMLQQRHLFHAGMDVVFVPNGSHWVHREWAQGLCSILDKFWDSSATKK
mmetsp:Transcript_11837/g.16785  ORF Transcript_11837/g.16785 Transcript_11837/m.16785 type:complete len:452 (-) Transcript_11837:130-1485(-)